jgi:hypothetical protein
VGRAGHPVDAIVLGSAGPGIAAMGRMSVGCALVSAWVPGPLVALGLSHLRLPCPGMAASRRKHAIRVRARVTHDRLAYDRQSDGHPRGRHPRAFPANLGSTEQRSASQQVAGRTLHPGPSRWWTLTGFAWVGCTAPPAFDVEPARPTHLSAALTIPLHWSGVPKPSSGLSELDEGKSEADWWR